VTEEDVLENYIRIKAEVEHLIRSEMALIEAKEVLEGDKVPAKHKDDQGQALSL
jgi:hypothetical protein